MHLQLNSNPGIQVESLCIHTLCHVNFQLSVQCYFAAELHHKLQVSDICTQAAQVEVDMVTSAFYSNFTQIDFFHV